MYVCMYVCIMYISIYLSVYISISLSLYIYIYIDMLLRRAYLQYYTPLWNRFGAVLGWFYRLGRETSISQNWLKGWKWTPSGNAQKGKRDGRLITWLEFSDILPIDICSFKNTDIYREGRGAHAVTGVSPRACDKLRAATFVLPIPCQMSCAARGSLSLSLYIYLYIYIYMYIYTHM